MTDLSFSIYRDFQEPSVQSACRAREARGCSAQGIEGDEEEEVEITLKLVSEGTEDPVTPVIPFNLIKMI